MSFYKSYIQYSRPSYRVARSVSPLLSGWHNLARKKRGIKKITLFGLGRIKAHSFILNVFLIILVLLTAVFYLWQVNNLAVDSFKIRKLERKIEELNYFNSEIEGEIIRIQSMDEVSKGAAKLGMVNVSRIDYLRPEAGHILAVK